MFRYADERKLALLDLADLRAVLTFLESDDGKADLSSIGGVSSATIGRLQGPGRTRGRWGQRTLFGEPQFEIADLMRTAADGRGVTLQCGASRPCRTSRQPFSTALMWLLAELFEQLPEVGDLDKPKLAFLFDEAHLLFDQATDAFLQFVTQTVRLIPIQGSRGVLCHPVSKGRPR